jgi:lipid-A-disaccharide synthase
VNLVAGRRIVPELLQDGFTAESVASALRPLLADGPEREQMMADLRDVGQKLRPASELSSIQRVCDVVESLLPGNKMAKGLNSTASV